MPQWLLLAMSCAALAAGVFALLRANRLDRAVRAALAELPAASGAPVSVVLPDAQGALSRVGFVRFDAFADVGGKLSTAAALLDEHGNGLVITTMHGRDTARSYIKQVRGGVGVVALSPEEQDAVDRAAGTRARKSA
jgi:hypothetical protein